MMQYDAVVSTCDCSRPYYTGTSRCSI